MSELKLKANIGAKMCLRSFDEDLELEIEVNDESIYLKLSQVIEVMAFLSNEVNKQGEVNNQNKLI
jgi:hypothetical protein